MIRDHQNRTEVLTERGGERESTLENTVRTIPSTYLEGVWAELDMPPRQEKDLCLPSSSVLSREGHGGPQNPAPMPKFTHNFTFNLKATFGPDSLNVP